MIKKSVLYPPIPRKLDPEMEKWCQDIISVIKDLRTEIVLDQPVAMRYTKNDAQPIPNNIITKIQYDDIDYDTHNGYNPVNFQYVIQYTGYYRIKASILTANVAWIADQIISLYIYVNNAPICIYRIEIEANITAYMQLFLDDTVYLNQGDLVDIRMGHNRGSETNTYTSKFYNYFSVHII